jgi:ribosome assembly protein 1
VDEKVEEGLYFMPNKGNVLFSSAIDGWAFSVPSMALFYHQYYKFDISIEILCSIMWGEYYLRMKQKKIVAAQHAMSAEREKGKTVFVQWCLQPLWDIYKCVE